MPTLTAGDDGVALTGEFHLKYGNPNQSGTPSINPWISVDYVNCQQPAPYLNRDYKNFNGAMWVVLRMPFECGAS